MKPPRSGNSRGPTQEVISPVQNKSTPKDAHASTPAKLGSTHHAQEEALRRFNDASRAFYDKALAPLGLRLMMEPIERVGGYGDDFPGAERRACFCIDGHTP